MSHSKPEVRPGGFGYIYFDVSDPVIAWMVYRGEIRSVDVAQKPGMVSWFLANTLGRHFLTIEREGQLESMRAAEFPGRLSRLTSLFAYPTLDDAVRGVEGGHFKAENLAEIGPATTSGYRKEIYDKGWIDNYSGLGKAADKQY